MRTSGGHDLVWDIGHDRMGISARRRSGRKEGRRHAHEDDGERPRIISVPIAAALVWTVTHCYNRLERPRAARDRSTRRSWRRRVVQPLKPAAATMSAPRIHSVATTRGNNMEAGFIVIAFAPACCPVFVSTILPLLIELFPVGREKRFGTFFLRAGRKPPSRAAASSTAAAHLLQPSSASDGVVFCRMPSFGGAR